MAKVRHSLASLTAAREPAAAGARGFYKGGPPPRRRSPRVEQLPWSGNVEYRVFPQNFGGQPLRKQRPLAITEAPSRLPALTPSPWVARVIVCSEADFLGDHRRLSPLSSPVSVGWGPLPEAGALRVITPAPVPDRLFSAQFQSRARGQEGLGSFAPEGLPERPWPLETHTQAPLKSRCSWGVPSASWAGGYQGKLTAITLEAAKPIAVDNEVFVAKEYLRGNIISGQATTRLGKACGIEKSYRPYKKLFSRKGLSSAKNQRGFLGEPKAATSRACGWSRAAGITSLRKRELLRAGLKESPITNRYRGHSSQLPLSARPRSKKPSMEYFPTVIDNNLPEPAQLPFINEKKRVFRKFICEPHFCRGAIHKELPFSDNNEGSIVEEECQEYSALNQTTTTSTQHLTGHSYQEPAVPEEISPELLAEFHRMRREDAAYLAVVRIIVCVGERDSHAGLPSGTLCPECREGRFPPLILDNSW